MDKQVKQVGKFEDKKITSRAEDYSQWYTDVIDAADLAEHSAVRGCMIIKPNGYAIWENIQRIMDDMFKKTGVRNAYFPMLIPEKFLKKEAEHVEGFAPEVAVVTHAGGKKLAEPLIVRPTSETIINDSFSKWVSSHRDLPLLINQWCNIVRWELRPRLFLRTTEFLWQEGHTAHATAKEAEDRAQLMLGVYKELSEKFLAIPVITGVKSDSEKFAGADDTYTIEAMMQDGKALQMGTSHNLGQNFAKAFDIQFSDENNEKKYVWQTSWGVSTRTIGGVIMAHSDDKGLVLPPKIAPTQVIIIPIWPEEHRKEEIVKAAKDLKDKLLQDEVRAEIDMGDERPGEKFYTWEKRGIPIRIEIGPKDIEKKSVVVARRDTSEKKSVSMESLSADVKALLDEVQENLFNRALEFRKNKTKEVSNWEEFVKVIEAGNFVLTHWAGDREDEAKVKSETGATIRCFPFDLESKDGVCMITGKSTNKRVVFAKSY